jgi:hypothetical protein
LESGGVAACVGIEALNGPKERVSILSATAIVLVNVGYNKALGGAPEALKETQYLGRLRVTVGAGFSKLSGKCTSFDKSTMLSIDGEEAGPLDFFPQIESSVIPVSELELHKEGSGKYHTNTVLHS